MMLPSLFRRQRGRPVPIRRAPDPVATLHGEMIRLFDDVGRSFGLPWPAWSAEGWESFAPSIDVAETDSEVRVTAELPGLEEKDFELSLDRETLTLRGEKKQESEERGDGWFRAERTYGSFERRIALPCEVDVDSAKAELRKGVLTVTLAKDPAAHRQRVQIPVRAS